MASKGLPMREGGARHLDRPTDPLQSECCLSLARDIERERFLGRGARIDKPATAISTPAGGENAKDAQNDQRYDCEIGQRC